MTKIIVNGKEIVFNGPIEVEVAMCPICGSHEVQPLDILVPDTVILPEFRSGFLCLECDAVFPSCDDLNHENVIFEG